MGSAWTECVRPIISVPACSRARATSDPIAASRASSSRSAAARHWSASAVSTTSLLVRP